MTKRDKRDLSPVRAFDADFSARWSSNIKEFPITGLSTVAEKIPGQPFISRVNLFIGDSTITRDLYNCMWDNGINNLSPCNLHWVTIGAVLVKEEYVALAVEVEGVDNRLFPIPFEVEKEIAAKLYQRPWGELEAVIVTYQNRLPLIHDALEKFTGSGSLSDLCFISDRYFQNLAGSSRTPAYKLPIVRPLLGEKEAWYPRFIEPGNSESSSESGYEEEESSEKESEEIPKGLGYTVNESISESSDETPTTTRSLGPSCYEDLRFNYIPRIYASLISQYSDCFAVLYAKYQSAFNLSIGECLDLIARGVWMDINLDALDPYYSSAWVTVLPILYIAPVYGDLFWILAVLSAPTVLLDSFKQLLFYRRKLFYRQTYSYPLFQTDGNSHPLTLHKIRTWLAAFHVIQDRRNEILILPRKAKLAAIQKLQREIDELKSGNADWVEVQPSSYMELYMERCKEIVTSPLSTEMWKRLLRHKKFNMVQTLYAYAPDWRAEEPRALIPIVILTCALAPGDTRWEFRYDSELVITLRMLHSQGRAFTGAEVTGFRKTFNSLPSSFYLLKKFDTVFFEQLDEKKSPYGFLSTILRGRESSKLVGNKRV